MTIPSTPRKAGPLLGNGVQTSWPFTFKVFADTDILVTVADNLGIESELTLTSDYTVTLNSNQETSPGGTVTYLLPDGYTLVITGDIDYDQPLDLPSGGAFSPTALENELDRLTMQIQQLREAVNRAVQAPITSNASGYLPSPQSNALIGWNESETAMQNFPLSEIATAIAFATYRYDTFTGDGATTAFVLSSDPVTLGNIDVSVDGQTYVPGVDHTLVGQNLVFTVAPADGVEILARYGQGMASGMSGDALDISYQPAGVGAELTTVEAKLKESVSVKDFGAVGDGITDDTAALNTAATTAKVMGVGLIVPAGLYVTTAPWVIPPGVPIIGVGQSWPVPGYNPAARLYGAVIWKKHSGHGVTITGTSAYDSAAPIQNISIASNNTTWATGNGFVLDKVTRCHLIDCNVWSVGGDSFVIGVTAGDVTGHNYLQRCYSNNPAGANFRIRAKWTRCDAIVSDGGTWGAVLDSSPETELCSWHFEGYSTGCIDVTNGSTSFAATGKGFMGNTAAALIGIRIKNDSGNVGARITNVYGAGGGTASSIGIDVVGAGAEDAQINGCLLEGWATGVRDTSTNTQVLNNKFYNCTLPISAGGTASIVRNNRTQAATGGWSIDHVTGGSGIWSENNLDQPVKSTSSGVVGNYGTNLVRANKGFKTRNAGTTGGVSGGSTVIPHGLIATPSTQLVTLIGASGATDIRASSDATNLTISWTGAGTYQFSWEVACTCERQY